jgi:hypothetical protein
VVIARICITEAVAARGADHRNIRRAALGTAGARDEYCAHAEPACAFDVVQQAVADHDRLVRLHRNLLQRRFEDARMRLHVTMIERRHRHGKQPFEREMGLERGQAPLGVGNEPDLQACRVQRAQHVGNIFVHLEVLTGGPLIVDIARRTIDSRPGAAHPLDNPPRVLDEYLRVVHIAGRLEHRRRQ